MSWRAKLFFAVTACFLAAALAAAVYPDRAATIVVKTGASAGELVRGKIEKRVPVNKAPGVVVD